MGGRAPARPFLYPAIFFSSQHLAAPWRSTKRTTALLVYGSSVGSVYPALNAYAPNDLAVTSNDSRSRIGDGGARCGRLSSSIYSSSHSTTSTIVPASITRRWPRGEQQQRHRVAGGQRQHHLPTRPPSGEGEQPNSDVSHSTYFTFGSGTLGSAGASSRARTQLITSWTFAPQSGVEAGPCPGAANEHQKARVRAHRDDVAGAPYAPLTARHICALQTGWPSAASS